MFTGIVERDATVIAVKEPKGKCVTIGVTHTGPRGRGREISVGDSISVNGVCLTVTKKQKGSLSFDVMEETLRRTNLAKLKKGSRVNVERSLRLSDWLGGHLMSGHVDRVGKVTKLNRMDDGSIKMFVEVGSDLTAMMIPKGSIAVDGVSLTLVDVGENDFSVCLIPHTLSKTTLGHVQLGASLNIEIDFFAKYVKKLVQQLTNPTSIK